MREERNGKTRLVADVLSQVMPPQYPLRETLRKVVMEWCSVVGEVLGNHSVPLDIIGEELLVATETPLIASRLSMMGGNVTRVLAEKWGLKVKKIKVTVGRLPLKNLRTLGSRSSRPFLVEVSEDEVAELERDYLQRFPDLPEDVALSLARLQAFFTKRFSKGRQ